MTYKNERAAHQQLLTQAGDQAKARRVLTAPTPLAPTAKNQAQSTRERVRMLRTVYRAGWARGVGQGFIWGLLIGMLIICVLVQWPNPTFEVWQ